MASAGAYDCPDCGGLVVVGNPEVIKAYGGEHVCDLQRIAERLYAGDPRLSVEDAMRLARASRS